MCFKEMNTAWGVCSCFYGGLLLFLRRPPTPDPRPPTSDPAHLTTPPSSMQFHTVLSLPATFPSVFLLFLSSTRPSLAQSGTRRLLPVRRSESETVMTT